MSRAKFNLNAPHLVGGYHVQQRNRKETQLSSPSTNARYTDEGAATIRKGYYDIGWDLGSAGNAANSLHVERFNITFFAVGTSVVYVDHNSSDTVVDTGITLSGAGTDTWFGEYNGDVYFTNTTDGLHRIVLTRLNGAVSSGAAAILIDQDGAARLSVFSHTTANLRIGEVDEAFNAVTVSTGSLTLVGTALNNYSDNAIAIVYHNISSGRPKGSKFVFWKETMNVIGVLGGEATANSDVPPTTMYYSDFATGGASENIVSFGANAYEMVGKSGIITNIVDARDYLYLFKNEEAYAISVGDVNLTSGARPPNLFSPKYGCINEKCADTMGDFIVWLCPQKRIMKSVRSVQDGVSVLEADEQFDRPLKEFLDLMDDDQSKAMVYYQTKAKELHVKVSIDGQYLEFVYDNDKRVWCPPDTNKLFNSYFEIDGNPYATSDNEDTVFQLDEGTDDDGADIECVIATGIYEYDDGRTWCEWKPISISGSLNAGATIEYTPCSENGEGIMKEITVSNESTGSAIGSIGVGSAIIGGGGEETSIKEFDEKRGIVPAKTRQIQHKFYTYGSGSEMSIKSWSHGAVAYTKEFLTTK